MHIYRAQQTLDSVGYCTYVSLLLDMDMRGKISRIAGWMKYLKSHFMHADVHAAQSAQA